MELDHSVTNSTPLWKRHYYFNESLNSSHFTLMCEFLHFPHNSSGREDIPVTLSRWHYQESGSSSIVKQGWSLGSEPREGAQREAGRTPHSASIMWLEPALSGPVLGHSPSSCVTWGWPERSAIPTSPSYFDWLLSVEAMLRKPNLWDTSRSYGQSTLPTAQPFLPTPAVFLSN